MATNKVMMDFNDGAMGSFVKKEPELNFRHEIRNPIVYTTKLDQMKIFRDDTTDMCVDTIINSIIKESKPKINLKRKRTYRNYFYYSYEDLTYDIDTFNRKVARIAENNRILSSMCKPMRVVVEDIKHTLLRKMFKEVCPIVSDPVQSLPIYSQSRKLKSRIIYDLQLQEADMYSLDKSYFIKKYTKFRIDKSNADTFRSLKMNKNVSEVSCCCWYNREKSLALLPFAPHETLRFMRKSHKCAINLCRCCCRKKTIPSLVRPSSVKPLESHSIWLNRMAEVHAALPLSDKSKQILLSKAMSAVPELDKNVNPVNSVIEVQDKLPLLHSTSIDFGSEYYAIGADGQIKLCIKNMGNDRRILSNLQLKTANNIVGDICCWYKREEFAGRLLALGALPNTVNYIRSAHSCSPTNCSCCCKPLNTGKAELTFLNKSARHTNDLVSKKVNIKVKFSGDAEKPVPVNAKTTNNVLSFNVSLSTLEIMSKGKTKPNNEEVFDLIIPESATIDQKNKSVRVLVGKTHKHKTVIQCYNLKSMTTKELKMLDLIFCAVNKNIKPPEEKIIRTWKNQSRYKFNTIYPLLLNTQLSVVTDLRSKRFLPSLRAHLEKHNVVLPELKNISSWLDACIELTRAKSSATGDG